MTEFRIRRGLSTTVFISPGIVNPKLLIEEGCWYLCTDTAELFLGIIDTTGKLTLKRINEITSDGNINSEVLVQLEELKKELVTLENIELYQKIESESDLPIDFTTESFNPNIIYYIPTAKGKINTYIFDKGTPGYLCTNNVDELTIRALVSELIEVSLEENLTTKLPEIIRETLEKTIIYGGDATPEN